MEGKKLTKCMLEQRKFYKILTTCIKHGNQVYLVTLQVCQEQKYQKMAPLSTVLGMYRERTYNRDSKAWTSVVCKYLHNAYSQFSIAMMTFLIEVRGKKELY